MACAAAGTQLEDWLR